MLEKLFGFNPHTHSVRTEIVAGITTFLTMAYILAVNPQILGDAGMDKGAVFTATAIISGLATIFMRHGLERILCLHRLHRHGIFVAICPDGRIHRRHYLYSTNHKQPAKHDSRPYPSHIETRNRCGYRTFHRLHRLAECRHYRKE